MGLLKIFSQTFIEREEFYSDYDDRSMGDVFQIEYSLHISIDTTHSVGTYQEKQLFKIVKTNILWPS